MFQIQLL